MTDTHIDREDQQQNQGWTEKAFASLTNQPQEPPHPPSQFVALVGDIHGSPKALLRAAATPGVVAVVQLGDFGLLRERIPQLGVPLYWLEGNHEQWKFIEQNTVIGLGGLQEITSKCWYVSRGEVVTVGGIRFLCGGGADSVDKDYQVRHGHWSSREQWSAVDEEAMCAATDVDVMLTHSPPQCTIATHFDPNDLTAYFGLPNTWTSPVAFAVQRVWEHHGQPPLYCGHMHRTVRDGVVRILNIDEVVLVPVRNS